MKRRTLAVLFLIFWSAAAGLHAQTGNEAEVDRQLERASNLYEQGHTDESKKIYQAVLAALRNRPPSPQVGFALNGLSKISAAAGDYKGAIEYARQSAEIYHNAGDSSGEAHALNNLGIAQIQTGSYPVAQRTLETALSLGRQGQDFENEVQIMNNLGSAYYYPGRYSEASHRYDEAMALVNKNTAAKWSAYWRQITSFNQATLYQRLGRYERAMQIYRGVEQSSKDLTASDRAHLFANLGALYRRLGDPYKALDIYRAAQKLYSEQHDAGGELTVIKNIGIVYALDMEDLTQARRYFTSAISLAQKAHNRREEMQAHLYLGETLFRSKDFVGARSEFDSSKALAAELGTTEEQWKSLYGDGRIEEQMGNLSAAETDYRQAIALIEKTRSQLQLAALRSEFFADKREAYDALIGLLMRRNDAAEVFSFLERSRARNFQDSLQTETGSQKGLDRAVTMELTQAHIPAETALLEFWSSGDQIGLVWCTKSKSGMLTKKFTSAELEKIRKYLDGMPDDLSGNWQEQLPLFGSLLPNVPKVFDGVRHLLIVPDGWISYVPFDLIAGGGNSKSPLIENYDISYLPTAALLFRSRRNRRIELPWSHEFVAFGDPRVGENKDLEAEEATAHEGAQPLPFSSQEILSIANLVRGRKEIFLRENDLKKYFLSSPSNAALLLHVSTHAFADADNPENSRLLFSPEAPNSGSDYVFLRELYDLDLSHVNLAVISACDTERGKMVRGEGVQAFGRALLSAGAASSVTALWRVDDEITAEFMKQFYYFALNEHKPKAEALRLAKLRFLHSNSKVADPRVWAAFVLNGDGATPLPSVVSWREITLLLVFTWAGVFAGLWIFLRQNRRIDRQDDARAVIR
jgi:CHAT domain-containing protein/Flp pilus assembly protein TadD